MPPALCGVPIPIIPLIKKDCAVLVVVVFVVVYVVVFVAVLLGLLVNIFIVGTKNLTFEFGQNWVSNC